MERSEVAAFVEKTYAARKAGDLEGVVKAFAPNAVMSLPGFVRAEGADEIRTTLKALIGDFEFLEINPVDLIVEGTRAALHWRLRLRHAPSGEIRETEVCDVWRFQNGLVVSFTQFCDTAMVAELAAGA
jgi:ketosteroid isomerase-like protein